MRTMRRLALAIPLSIAVAVGGLAAPASAYLVPTDIPVTVTPSTGLAGGDTVTVTAVGLPPGAEVRVNQCEAFTGDLETDCGDYGVTTADAAGRVSTTVVLSDPVWRSEPFGDSTPEYCRADMCRIFLAWTDADGNLAVASSDPLAFTGSPATITVTPSSDLRRKQWVRVTGTAYGAEGRTVVVVEEACFSIIQGSGCYGTIVERTGTVAPDGTYAFRVRATRYLADGTDCADPGILGYCELSVQVLDGAGQPDDSFGVSLRGQPAAFLTFRS